MIEKDYLNEKQEWITYRIEKLDQIKVKLVEMRHLAEYARDYKLSGEQIEGINVKLRKLQQEVIEMDERSKTFWLENQ